MYTLYDILTRVEFLSKAFQKKGARIFANVQATADDLKFLLRRTAANSKFRTFVTDVGSDDANEHIRTTTNSQY